VLDDVERVRGIGTSELILDFHAVARSVDELVDSALCITEPLLMVA
jgi:hypothetical protein